MAQNDRLITPEEAADLLQVAPSTLVRWRRLRTGPPYVRLGHRTVRYRTEDLVAWIASNQQGAA